MSRFAGLAWLAQQHSDKHHQTDQQQCAKKNKE